MTSSRHLAFDLGAGSGRAILGELNEDRLSIRELHRFSNRMLPIGKNLHWNLLGIYGHLLDVLRQLGADDTPPDSIGIDTWGVDFGLLTANDQLLGLPHAYRDPHTNGAMEYLFERIAPERIYELTGIQLIPINTLFQLASMVRDGSPLLDIATDLLFIPDLLHFLLSGKKRSEFTFATTSQLYNPKTGIWEEELFDALGISSSLMLPILKPGQAIGALQASICKETGLPSIPILACATHDTGSAIAAIPAQGESWAYISSGTWSLIGIETEAPIFSEAARLGNFTNEGGVCGTNRFLKNVTGLWLLQECIRHWSPNQSISYAELLQQSKQQRAFAALIDPDDPKFALPENMPDAICEYCRESGQTVPGNRATISRCIMESLAFKTRFVLDQIQAIRQNPIERLHIIGGGSQNKLLCQFTANATGLTVEAGPVEATAMGNILMQAMGQDRIQTLERLREIVRLSDTFVTYKPKNTEVWETHYQRFLELIEK